MQSGPLVEFQGMGHVKNLREHHHSVTHTHTFRRSVVCYMPENYHRMHRDHWSDCYKSIHAVAVLCKGKTAFINHIQIQSAKRMLYNVAFVFVIYGLSTGEKVSILTSGVTAKKPVCDGTDNSVSTDHSVPAKRCTGTALHVRSNVFLINLPL